MKVQVGVSNRHVHLTEEHLHILFGKDSLEKVRDLNQPGQFASSDFVTIKTDKSEIERVRVLGPARNYTQVEISKSDAIKLGINPPVRESGDVIGSSPITIIGPNGEINLEYGCIIATRHIHITPKQMEFYGLVGKDKVDVLLPGEKGGILFDVSLRVNEQSYFEMHLDTDDSNAHLIKQGDIAEILEDK
jgi:putative phosphotransacetylase